MHDRHFGSMLGLVTVVFKVFDGLMDIGRVGSGANDKCVCAMCSMCVSARIYDDVTSRRAFDAYRDHKHDLART